MRRKFKAGKKVIAVLMLVAFIGIAGAVIYNYSGSSLSSGSFNNTFYNSSGFVQLNYTGGVYASQGTYTSTIIDFGETAGFVEISWKGSRSCTGNMSYIDKFGGYCIDQYEAYNAGSTKAGSAPYTAPWVSVSQTTALTACINAGKHLCSSTEWLGAANMQGKVYNLVADLSASPYLCNTNSKCGGSAACGTRNSSGCVSAEGVYDMVGNVWEWTSDVVNTIKPCNIGSDGNCYPNSTLGWQTNPGASTAIYGNDGVYFSASNNTGKAVSRGGTWASGADAGVFAVRLGNAPGDTGTGIGFRCCAEPI